MESKQLNNEQYLAKLLKQEQELKDQIRTTTEQEKAKWTDLHTIFDRNEIVSKSLKEILTKKSELNHKLGSNLRTNRLTAANSLGVSQADLNQLAEQKRQATKTVVATPQLVELTSTPICESKCKRWWHAFTAKFKKHK